MATRKKRTSARTASAEAPAPAPQQRGSERVVAVTGAFGSVGRKLIARLEADDSVDKVVAIDVRAPVKHTDDPAEFLRAHRKLSAHTLDLTEAGADAELAAILKKESVGALVHLAFLSTPTHALEMAHELETIGTLYVLHAAAEANVGYLLSLSSAMCYGARPTNPAWITEDQPLSPPQSRSLKDRADADAQVLRFGEEHRDKVVCVARVGATLLSAPDHLWTRTFARPVVPAVLGYDPLLQLMLHDDAVEALHALFRARAGGAFNVVGRGVLPLSHVLTRLGRLPLYLPAKLGASLVGTLWSTQLVDMPRHFLEYLRWSWVCDDARLLRATGFQPQHDIQTVLNIFAAHAKTLGKQHAADGLAGVAS